MSTGASTFVDEVLGEFVTHDRPRRDSAWRSWTGSVTWAEDRIRLGLGGDAHGPHPWLLDELREVVGHLAEIVARAAQALTECAPDYDIAQFRIESIQAWDEIDVVFEVTFEGSDRDARPNVETAWPPGQTVHHRIVIGRDYRAVRRDGQMKLPAPKVPADYPGPKPG